MKDGRRRTNAQVPLRRALVVPTAWVAASCIAAAALASCSSPLDEPDVGPTTSSTRWGAAVQRPAGEDYGEAVEGFERQVGPVDFLRVYYEGMPEPWPGRAPGRDVVVSFKLPPTQVVSGRFDTQMRQWFASVPGDVDVVWVYWHEPEDDAEQGLFAPEEYRLAFEHLARLADDADPQGRLRSASVLMSYSLQAASGRDWMDYYPEAADVDVVAWDVYSRGGRRCADYCDPDALFDAARRASASVGKPFAVAELGAALAPGDDGAGRADWLLSVADYAHEHDVLFVSWFNFLWNDGQDDYRLDDGPSREAWRGLGAAGDGPAD